jgi:beta-glucosidase
LVLATKPFPDNFLWGTATAPYQVEVGLHQSDFYQWESTTANASGQHADDGPDEYDHYDGDFALAEQLGNNTARLGIDFSRIFPTKSSFPDMPDAAAVAHYHAVLASMKAHHLQPMVTLYHWVFPIWVDDLTQPKTVAQGWLDDGTIQVFGQFAGWAAKEYGGEVDWWVTLNEPTVTAIAGFATAKYPPLRSFTDPNGVDNALHGIKNLIYAHAAAYDAIHAADTADADGDGQAAMVSCAFHQRVFEPTPTDDPATLAKNMAAAERIHYLNNLAMLNAVTKGNLDYDLDETLDGPNDKTADPALANRLDWVGVNYYGVSQVLALDKPIGPITGFPQNASLDDDRPHTAFRWSIDPEGFRTVLDEVKPLGLPILITENGVADGADVQRPRFIAEHLAVLQKAIEDGIDVRGYYHWSLIDNFEWAAGYCPQFGLYHVDESSPDKTRTLGEGGRVYQQIIQTKTVGAALLDQYQYGDPPKYCQGG